MSEDVLLRSQGALDLMLGRRDRGWSRLDLSADGFWNSFLAIPVCAPALLVILLTHARWLAAGGVEASTAAMLVVLIATELANWVLTLLAVVLLARPLGLGQRVSHLVVALNWGSVTFAYLRALPAALALLVGLGEGLAVAMLTITLVSLVLYWRLLAAAMEADAARTTAVFVATVALGYGLTSAVQSAFGLVPTAVAQ